MSIPLAHSICAQANRGGCFLRAGHDEVQVQGSSEKINHSIEIVVLGSALT